MDVTAELAQRAAGVRAGIESDMEGRAIGGAEAPVVVPGPDGTPGPQPTADPQPLVVPARRFRIVTVVSVVVMLPDQFPTIVLEDVEEHHRQIGFRVGMAEGAAIASALEHRPTARPLTHDLFAQALERFAVDVLAVRLTGRVGATYLAELELMGARGRVVLSCRPSDGIALSLRRRVAAPVLADERLFMEQGDVLPDAVVSAPEAGEAADVPASGDGGH